MAEPTLAPPPRRLSPLSPWVVFPLLALVLAVSVLLAPATGSEGDDRLTTLSTTPRGARGLAELVERLGWEVARDSMAPSTEPLDRSAVYAVLGPPEELTGREVHRYLDAVRAGAGLLVVVRGRGDPFADSLGVARSGDGARMRIDSATVRGCPPREKTFGVSWPQGAVYSYWLVPFRPIRGDTLLLIVNGDAREADFVLPSPAEPGLWVELVDSAGGVPRDVTGVAMTVAPHSLVLLRYGTERRAAPDLPTNDEPDARAPGGYA